VRSKIRILEITYPRNHVTLHFAAHLPVLSRCRGVAVSGQPRFESRSFFSIPSILTKGDWQMPEREHGQLPKLQQFPHGVALQSELLAQQGDS